MKKLSTIIGVGMISMAVAIAPAFAQMTKPQEPASGATTAQPKQDEKAKPGNIPGMNEKNVPPKPADDKGQSTAVKPGADVKTTTPPADMKSTAPAQAKPAPDMKTTAPAPAPAKPGDVKTTAPAPAPAKPGDVKTTAPAPAPAKPGDVKTTAPAPAPAKPGDVKTTAPAPAPAKPGTDVKSAATPPQTKPDADVKGQTAPAKPADVKAGSTSGKTDSGSKDEKGVKPGASLKSGKTSKPDTHAKAVVKKGHHHRKSAGKLASRSHVKPVPTNLKQDKNTVVPSTGK